MKTLSKLLKKIPRVQLIYAPTPLHPLKKKNDIFHSVNQYIKRETKIENYDPCPRFLSKMKVSPIAKLVYTTLLGRTFLSRKNGLKDENGNVYVIYPVRALAKIGN